MAAGKSYPHVPQIKDYPTQQSIKLLWDQVHNQQDLVAALTAELARTNSSLTTSQTTITTLNSYLAQSLIPNGSAAIVQPNTGGGSTGNGGGGTDPGTPTGPGEFPPGNGGGDGATMGSAQVYSSIPDIFDWPVTTTITQVVMAPSPFGQAVHFGANATWPPYTPPGWTGNIQYTMWIFVRVSGLWYTSGFIQMWQTRENTGAPILTEWQSNWAYDQRWGPMMTYTPAVGDEIGYMVSAGNARGVGNVTSVRERSNIVSVHIPAGNSGTFNF